MASKSVGSLFVNIVAKTTKFDKGLKDSQSKLKRFGASVVNMGKKLLAFGSIMTGVAVGGMVVFARGQLEMIDKLAKTAHALGITTEALGGLQHAAELTGVSNDQLATALKRMEKTISDASVGLSTAKRALAQLGLSVKDFQGLKPEQQFALIGDELNSIKEQTDKARIAQDIFGRSGIMLINTLKLGSQGLKDMAADAKALGLTFTDEEAASVERFNDQMTRLKGLIGGLGRRFVIDIAPAAAETIQALVLLAQQRKSVVKNAKERTGINGMSISRIMFPGPIGEKISRVEQLGFRIAAMVGAQATGNNMGINSNLGPTAHNENRRFMERQLHELEKIEANTAQQEEPAIRMAIP